MEEGSDRTKEGEPKKKGRGVEGRGEKAREGKNERGRDATRGN